MLAPRRCATESAVKPPHSTSPTRCAAPVYGATLAPMPSFDVVSKVNLMELDNALNTAAKELAQRYDFRGTNTTIERGPEGVMIRSSDEPHASAALSVLRERMAKRNVSQRCLDPRDVEAAGGQT